MRQRNGFTLVELLVVVGILAILAGLVVVFINPARHFERARDSRRLGDLTTVQSALEQYFSQNNDYPTDITFGGVFSSGGITYLKSVPNDPQSTESYEYCTDAGQDNYEVCSAMETTPLPSDCATGTLSGAPVGANCTTYNCCLTNPF